MALPITKWGSWSRSAGIYSALAKQAKLINYGAVQKLTFEFDPFRDVEEKFNHTRIALSYMNCPNLRATNAKCILKTNIVSDRSPPNINIKLIDGSEVLFKTENLSTLEILRLFNELVSSKAPKKQEVSILQTKAEKAAAKKRR